jgi:hypothetical protein
MKKVVIPGDVIFFNGIYITDEAIKLIDSLQTGGTLGWAEKEWDKREFNNKGLNHTIAELDEVSSYLINVMDYDEKEKDKCCEMLTSLSWIRSLIKSFSAPANIPDLLKQD